MYFYDEDALITRLVHTRQKSNRRVVFLVGSAITAPTRTHGGVPTSEQLVEQIRTLFQDDKNSVQRLEQELAESGGATYQTAFRFLIGRRGLDAANRLIKTAVLAALQSSVRDGLGENIPTDDTLKSLEEEPSNWTLNPSTRALGLLVSKEQKALGSILLTSNFDPLISVAIRDAGGQVTRTALHADGSISQTEGPGCHVIHFHGFWRQSDTLHTVQQLSHDRPKLSASLRDLLKDALVVAIGYGGWDDIFTRALIQVAQDDLATPEVLWCFRSADQRSIEERYRPLLANFSPGIGRGRVNLYAGVDCNLFLPALVSALGIPETTSSPDSSTDGAPILGILDSTQERVILFEIDYGKALEEPLPSTDDWEGRDPELRLLQQSDATVIAISGLGGQGKSTLASYFAQRNVSQPGPFEAFEWRDCREQGHRISTAIASSVLSLSSAGIADADLESRTAEQLVDLLFRALGQRRVLFVFDNVDHYIDLETGDPEGHLATLIDQALTRSHRSLFLFTSRPPIHVDKVRFQSLKLEGLDREAARRLFDKKSRSGAMSETELDELLQVTLGHPIWIAIIAGWTGRDRISIRDALNRIAAGGGELPSRLLNSIWKTLADRHHRILRIMAEMERPETEDTLCEMVEGMTYNKFQQTLRVLKTLNLVQLRLLEGSHEVLDLHPLVRHFVRSTFPKKERSTFITRVLTFLDRRYSAYKSKGDSAVPREFLEYGIQRIDLALNAGLVERATDAYIELSPQLMRRGLAEQCVRLGLRLLAEMDWAHAATSFSKFDAFVQAVAKILIEGDELVSADACISKYEQCIPGRGAQFINLCDIKCYRFWFVGEFEQAMHWGLQGVQLKERTNVDTQFDCDHNYALSMRDSGSPEKALSLFLHGETLDNVLKEDHKIEDRGGPYYGNIGRCLQLIGNLGGALICYRKSARFIEEDTQSSTINRGYIRYWVGQVLQLQKRWEDSTYVLIAALRIWREVAPRKSESILDEIETARGFLVTPIDPEDVPDWKAENRFLSWLNSSS